MKVLISFLVAVIFNLLVILIRAYNDLPSTLDFMVDFMLLQAFVVGVIMLIKFLADRF